MFWKKKDKVITVDCRTEKHKRAERREMLKKAAPIILCGLVAAKVVVSIIKK